ncbi:MAG: TetR/AcrR family transcriptional regulator [Caldilineaceae bacterium]|nr:TetR/AcrR family transcriptional regulator [Caldilineaceae bacterium]
MARIVKEYDERNTEFLDVAQELFYRKGYEQTSVQDIIRAVGVAKGTFYHYFASKSEMLDALVERVKTQVLAAVAPIVADESLGAVEKFEQIFDSGNQEKVGHKDFLLAAMHAFYDDQNVLLRTKLLAKSVAMMVPLLAAIIRQGVAEGVFDVDYPDEAAEIVIQMGQSLSDAMVQIMLGRSEVGVEGIVPKIDAYNRSVERVLGAPKGSLHLISQGKLAMWLPEGELFEQS